MMSPSTQLEDIGYNHTANSRLHLKPNALEVWPYLRGDAGADALGISFSQTFRNLTWELTTMKNLRDMMIQTRMMDFWKSLRSLPLNPKANWNNCLHQTSMHPRLHQTSPHPRPNNWLHHTSPHPRLNHPNHFGHSMYLRHPLCARLLSTSTMAKLSP
jgi:hypothetical protein